MFRQLRHIIGLVIVWVFTALSVAAMPMAPTAAYQAEFFAHQQAVVSERTNVHFAARAPPPTVADVAITGAAVAVYCNSLIMHEHELHVASLGFVGDFDATKGGDDFANPGTRPGATDAEAGGASYYDQYRKADGSGWDWPENLGFAGTPTEATMPVGTRLDRYGSADGSFMSPAGTPLEQRAMAPGSAAEPLRTYEVAKPLPVIQGEVAPAFGQSGGGTQMLPNLSERVNVDWLVRNGYLKEVN